MPESLRRYGVEGEKTCSSWGPPYPQLLILWPLYTPVGGLCTKLSEYVPHY